ncbi:histidine kinase [Ralstonia sp. 1138]|uniref:histidine kinase n=1 Tax=Ralstonia sp. 1138 TaxID=3156423 RepID=UPI003394B7A5
MTEVRAKWPTGWLGTVSYWVDHGIFRFREPVDWLGMAAIDMGWDPANIDWPTTKHATGKPEKRASACGTLDRPHLLTAVVTLAMAGLCTLAYLCFDTYRSAREHLEEQVVSYVHLIAAHDQDSFVLADTLLQGVADALMCADLTGPLSPNRHREMSALLQRYRQRLPGVASFTIIGQDGIRRAGIVGPDNTDLSRRGYFVALKNGRDFFISNVEDGLASGKTGIHVARRVSGPAGEFCGAVQLNLGAKDVFYRFYQSLKLDDGFEAALRDSYRHLIKFPEALSDKEEALSPLLAEQMGRGTRQGVIELPGAANRPGKLVAFERLGDSSIYALVAVPNGEALRRQILSFVIASLGMLALAMCVVMASKLARLTAQLNNARATAEEAVAKKRKMIGRIDEAVEIERKRIAGDIHDTLNAEVVQIKLHAQHIQFACDEADGAKIDDIKKHVAAILAVTQKTYEWGRQLVRNLRPESIDALGVQGAIAQAVQTMNSLHPSCEFILQGDECVRFASDQVSMVAYRVVQEALMNTAKHAGASCVVVSLQAESANRVRIVVMDDGNGFDPVAGAEGYGLASMRERVESVDGQLRIQAAASRGCRLEVVLPC